MNPTKRLVLRAGPIRIGLEVEHAPFAAIIIERYGRYLTRRPPGVTITIQPHRGFQPGYAPDIRHETIDGGCAVMSSSMAFTYHPARRQGLLQLAPDRDQAVDSIENALRVAVQRLAIERGCLLVHAGAAARVTRGVLFPAGEGGGKSTLAGLCRAAGCSILGDDLVMAARGRGRTVFLYGVPFRGETTVRRFRIGPVRLARLVFIAHGRGRTLTPLDRSEAAGRLAAHVPFITGAPRPVLAGVLETVRRMTAFHPVTFAYDLGSRPEGVVGRMLGRKDPA
ncbi:MAG: hypothetical protein ABIF71_08610 [Planctomycetota bacterium]